jgi:hypothetical protein
MSGFDGLTTPMFSGMCACGNGAYPKSVGDDGKGSVFRRPEVALKSARGSRLCRGRDTVLRGSTCVDGLRTKTGGRDDSACSRDVCVRWQGEKGDTKRVDSRERG